MAGLYLHIPFCEHKCVYCDFYSIAPSEEKMDERALQATFTESLVGEIRQRATNGPSVGSFSSIFLGGGTPSLLQPDQAQLILDTLRENYTITEDAEITLEANPGTVTKERLESFHRMGFNRISFGVQSFQDHELQFLTRIHSADQAERSIRDAREAGFTNVSLDLMFGLPDQTVESWMGSLERGLSLEPEHISCYSLTVEPNTPLARLVRSGSVTMLDRNIDASLYECTIQILGERGYEQYEVSNFCRPGMSSRHNLNYWTHDPYLGFGPSAHSYVDGVRWWNIANLSTYTDLVRKGTLPVEGKESLTRDQRRTEQVFLGLRGPGLDLDRYEKLFGSSFLEEQRERIDALIGEGRAAVNGSVLALTGRGYMICDEICATLT